MKVQELFEKAINKTIEYKSIESINTSDTIEIIKKYASDALWMLKENRPIYRGSVQAFDKIASNVSIADPSKTKRKSSNTKNYYTLIFDNHPEMKDFPKRSRSFIASTDLDKALSYGGQDYDNLYVLIPFNGVKMGIVHSEDIWDLRIDLFGENWDLKRANTVFRNLGLTDNSFNEFIKYEKQINKPGGTSELLKKNFAATILGSKDDIDYYTENFLKHIFDAYSPKRIGLTVATTATMPHNLNSEVWIGGKCLVIKYNHWKNVVEKYNFKP